MNCGACGYVLFNLPKPRCPECNTPFDVRTYTFEPGTVQFGCPHCDQLYEGNDARGLPHPPRFTCVNCQNPVDVSVMRVVPVSDQAAGFDGMAVGAGLPWERTDGTGMLTRWWQTCKLGMFRPTEYYRQLRGTEDLSKAIGFAALSAVFSGVLGTIITGVFQIALLGAAGASQVPGSPSMATNQGGMMVFQVLMAIPAQILVLFVLAGIVQLGLAILVRQRRSYTSTVVVLAYATCPAIWGLIPFIGGLAVPLWSLVVSVLGLAVIHNTTWWRALLAFFMLGLIILAVVLVILGGIALAA